MARKSASATPDDTPPEEGANFQDQVTEDLWKDLKKVGNDDVVDYSAGVREVEAIPTGVLVFDHVTGCGGFPRGRITELYGPEACYKSSLCLMAASNVLKNDGVVLYIDLEQALTPEYLRRFDIDFTSRRWIHIQPTTTQDCHKIIETSLSRGVVDLIILDSVPSLIPRELFEVAIDKENPIAIQARRTTEMITQLVGLVNKTNTALVFINQLRTKIGNLWGPPEDTPGGRALKYYASLRISLTAGQKEFVEQANPMTGEMQNLQVGSYIHISLAKSKVGQPFLKATMLHWFATGFDNVYPVIEKAKALGLISTGGAGFFKVPGKEETIRGTEALFAYYRDCPDNLATLQAAVDMKPFKPDFQAARSRRKEIALLRGTGKGKPKKE